jgi:hypothetical protein
MTSYEQYIALTAAVYAFISSSYMHILTLSWGGCMSVYASICQYMQVCVCISIRNTCIYIKQFMNVFPTVYLAVYLYVFPTVFLAVLIVHINTATVTSWLLRIRRLRPAVSASSPRGRHGKFVVRQCKRSRLPHSIRSGLRD